MKRILFSLCLLLTAWSALAANDVPDPAVFARPPMENQTAAWWHWIDGALTREGITKDLEAMKAQGISNATVLNIYRRLGIGYEGRTVDFGTPEWYAIFRHAVEEADRLGMEIGAANCDGWSESGGPWITPELSMKQYTWRKTFVHGNGRTQKVQLLLPPSKEHFYRDVAVVAYRSEAPNSFVAAAPKVTCHGEYPITTLVKNHEYYEEDPHLDQDDVFPGDVLVDGSTTSMLTLDKDKTVLMEFAQPFTAEVLCIQIMASKAPYPIPVVIEVSEDGRAWKEAGRVYARGFMQQKLPFPRTESRYWRLTINEPLSPTTFSELSLLKAGERSLSETVPGVTIPSTADVVNLTGKMSKDGTLRWAAPEGDWTVIRFGYTSTGKNNHPASPQGVGLECDKMDTTALNIHFKAFPQKLIDAAGPLAGKTFTYFLVDSWECGQQTWTEGFQREFKRRRGYDLTAWIPVLCGERIASVERSQAFQFDFDRTRGELVQDNYFKHLADLCHRAGMKLWSEGIYGGAAMPPVDVLKSYEYCDVPMTEFWAQAWDYVEWPVVFRPANYGNHAIPYHVSLIYDKPVVGSEAFTGMALYSDSPIDLKLYGDLAYTQGVNRMILHSYVHQPDNRRPGVTLGIYGQTFNRNNTWFNAGDGFFGTQARIQYLLQLGDRRSDALVYLGDRLPNTEMTSMEIERSLPANIKFQYINQEVLLNRLSVKDGKIWLDGRHPFKFLLLRGEQMQVETARALERLVNAGARVYGPRPGSTLSLVDLDKHNAELAAIVARLWDSGKVRNGLDAILEDYVPDLQLRGLGIDDVLYYHKTIGDVECYYVSSKDNNRPVNFEAVFDAGRRRVEIWDPMTGLVREQTLFVSDASKTVVPMTLQPRQGVFVMLRPDDGRPHIVRLTDRSGAQLFPNTDGSFVRALPEATRGADGKICLRGVNGGAFRMELSDKGTAEASFAAARRVVVDGSVGTMSFEDEPAIGTLPIGVFRDLSGFLDLRIKYYSGRVTYRTEAELPDGFVRPGCRVLLAIPAFGSTAQVTINGHTLETVWDPAAMTDISAWVRPGKNDLVIQVTNPWRNRIIGDLNDVPSTEQHWTTSPLQQKNTPPRQIIHKYTRLYPAGISQPITIYSEDRASL